MRITWLGIFFHATILLWLLEEHGPTRLRTTKCRLNQRKTSRLLLFVIPGLNEEHRGLLREIQGAHLWVSASPLLTPELSLATGLTSPVLLPATLDTIFERVNTTFFAGRRTVVRSSTWMKVYPALYRAGQAVSSLSISVEVKLLFVSYQIDEPHYMRVKGAKGERSEIDAMEDVLVRAFSNPELDSKIRREKVIFYVRFDRLYPSRHTPSKIHRAVRDVISFTKAVNAYCVDNFTNAVLWGDQSGPMVLWGPDLVVNFFTETVQLHRVTPLMSALLNTEVPSDSADELPSEFLDSIRARAEAAYCNAQQLGIRAISLKNALIFSTNETLDSSKFFRGLQICERFLQEGKMKLALDCSTLLSQEALKSAQIVEKSRRRVSNIGKGLTILAWMTALCSELAMLSYDDHHPPRPSWYLYLHAFFLAMLFCNLTGFVIMGCQHFEFLFFSVTITMSWLLAGRYHYWYPVLKMVTVRNALKAMFFCALLSFASIHAQSSLSSPWMSNGVCLLAQLLTFPRYSKSPIIVTYAWWTLSLFLLLCIHFSPCDGPSTKLVNFGGTMWLCLSGFASFWLRPVKDIVLCALLALSVCCAMLLQYSAITTNKFHEINYVGFLFFLAPLLPLLGERKKSNRILLVGVSSAVGIILTSPCMEAISFLICLVLCFVWSILEKYKSQCHALFSFETCRRGTWLSLLLVTSDRVTQIIPFADIRFLDKSALSVVTLYRQTIVLGSLLAVFFILMPVKQAHAAFTLTQFIVTVASIRSAYFSVESWYDVHQFGIALVAAYYFARVLGTVRKKKKPIDGNAAFPVPDERNIDDGRPAPR